MGQIIGGASQIVGSLIGGRRRRREQAQAQAEFDQRKADYQNFQFKNTYENLENTAEDLTVNQQAANFQAQQTDQALAQGLDAVRATGGGGGGAQAIANAALQAKQGASADISRQEQQNQQLRAQQAASNQALEAQGADTLQTRQHQQAGEAFDLSGERLSAANAARQKATQDLIGGIGSVAGGIASGGFGDLGNLFGNKQA
ncbi:MAG: hypothetical protein MPJ25_00390 [Pirellulales bacterium]|nr:hypothetical protein [Pirellulales bacterium]